VHNLTLPLVLRSLGRGGEKAYVRAGAPMKMMVNINRAAVSSERRQDAVIEVMYLVGRSFEQLAVVMMALLFSSLDR